MKVNKIKFSDIVGMLERDEMKEILGGSGGGSGYPTGNSLLNSFGGGGGSGGGTGGIGSTFASMGFGGGTAIGSSIGGQSYSGYSSPVTNSYYTSSGSSYGTSNNGTSNASFNNAWNNTSSGTTTNNPVAISRVFDFIYANNGIVNSSQINSFIANESTAAGQVANNQLYGIVLNTVNVVNNYHGPSTIPQGIVINNGMVQINNTANVNNSGTPKITSNANPLGAFQFGWDFKSILTSAAFGAKELTIAEAQYIKYLSGVSNIANAAGVVLIGADVLENGFKLSHVGDLFVQAVIYDTALAVPVAGWIVGGAYFVGDQYFKSTHNGMSITQYYLNKH